MAGLMQRAGLIVKAKFSKLLNRAENPTETLDYSYEQMAAQQQLQGLDMQIKQLSDQQEKLIAGQQQLETRIEAFRSQKEVMKAQYSAAEAQVKIGEAATGIGRGMADTGQAIQRAKEKTEELQARASAIDELTSTGALEDFTAGDQTQLDRELAQISSTNQVDQDLARLKAEVGAGDESKQLAAGDAEPAPGPTQQQEQCAQEQPAEQ